MASKYSHRSHTSEQKFRKLLRGFLLDLDASTLAQIVGLNRNTVNRYFLLLRERISDEVERESPWGTKDGVNATDASLYCIIVRDGKVHTRAIPQSELATARDLLHGHLEFDGQGLEDWWTGAAGLIDLNMKEHRLLKTGKKDADMVLLGQFMVFMKRRLSRFRGIHPSTYHLHIKECEWRFNHQKEDLYHFFLSRLRELPLKAGDITSGIA